MDIDQEIIWAMNAEPGVENIQRLELLRHAIANRIAALDGYIARHKPAELSEEPTDEGREYRIRMERRRLNTKLVDGQLASDTKP